MSQISHLLLDYALCAAACLAVVVAFWVNDERIAQRTQLAVDATTIDGLADVATRLTKERDLWERVAQQECERADRIARQLARATHPHRLQHPLVRVTARTDREAWAGLIGGGV